MGPRCVEVRDLESSNKCGGILSVLPSNFASNTFNMFVSYRRKVSHFPGGQNSALGCKNYGA